MFILLPLDSDDRENASLVLSTHAKVWALVVLEDGKVQDIGFYDDRSKIEEMIDAVILPDKNDYTWSFIEENIPVLIAPFQRNIEDII